jgi:TIR domain
VAKVFVSHASEDHIAATKLHQWLGDDGHDVFLDQDLRDGIAVGEEWEQRLYERLRWADAVVCLITAAYNNSAWCAAEVGIARSQGSRLLPVRAEPGEVHPLLMPSQYQYADLASDALAARTALCAALRRLDAAGGWGWPDGRSPFPGLRRFDTELHRVFFGRSDEVAARTGCSTALTSRCRQQSNAARRWSVWVWQVITRTRWSVARHGPRDRLAYSRAVRAGCRSSRSAGSGACPCGKGGAAGLDLRLCAGSA